MAGRPKKQVESTENIKSESVVNNDKSNETTIEVGSQTNTLIQNIDGIGCIVNYYFFHNDLPINMTTTFLPNVKSYFDEENNIKFSHINA